MQIKCPECGFTRDVNEGQIPSSSSFATCPKCATRFRFRAEPEPEIEKSSSQPAAQPEEAVSAQPPVPPVQPSSPVDGSEPKEGDIWASMDKMRLDWEEIDREEQPRNDAADATGEAGAPGRPEDEARLREEASRAYRQAATHGRIPLLSTVGSVPWEYRGGFMNPLVFVRTALLMITRAPQFFSGINPFSSIIPAWVFLMAVRSVQMAVASAGTKVISTAPDGTQQILSIAEVFNIPSLILTFVCMITLLHFLGSFIVNYAIQNLARTKGNFRLTFKVMAYANMPVILSAIPGVGGMLGFLGSLILLFVGIRHAYNFDWRKTAISVLPYLIIAVLLWLMMMQAAMSAGS